MNIESLRQEHFPEVLAIYKEGLDTGVASFETKLPNWDEWNKKFLPECRFVVTINKEVAAWCGLTAVSKRLVYIGVVENTIYVRQKFQKKGIGKRLLEHLINASEKEGFWTLQASIFPSNKGSVLLHERCGFRRVGIRQRIAQRDGIWHDNVLFERRSKKINSVSSSKKNKMKNVLVLCTGNSCRSQMAHGYLNLLSNGKANIYSAGIETHGLNPGAVAIMKEDDIDITGHTSNLVTEYDGINWDFILTVCDHANENCPFIAAPDAKRLHHNFFDPSKVIGNEEEKHAAFLKARNEIRSYCEDFNETYL